MSIQAKDLNLNCRFRQNAMQGEGLVLRLDLVPSYQQVLTNVTLHVQPSWQRDCYDKYLGIMDQEGLRELVPLVSKYAGEHKVEFWLKVNDGTQCLAFRGQMELAFSKDPSIDVPQTLNVYVDAQEHSETDVSIRKDKSLTINLGTPAARAEVAETTFIEVPLFEREVKDWPVPALVHRSEPQTGSLGIVNVLAWAVVVVLLLLVAADISGLLPAKGRRSGRRDPKPPMAPQPKPDNTFEVGVRPPRPIERTAGDIYPGLKKSYPLLAATSATTPFTNSLSMRFMMFIVSQRGEAVLFSQMETRVSDFKRFMVEEHRRAESGEFDATGQGTICRGSWDNPGFTQEPDHPVVWITSKEALDFCCWLTAKERATGRIPQGWAYRLPVKEEWWEVFKQLYGSTSALFHNLDGNWADSALAKNGPESQIIVGMDPLLPCMVGYNDKFAFTSPAGAATTRDLPLADMAGNVYELTQGTWPEKGTRWAHACGGACNVGMADEYAFEKYFQHAFHEQGRYPFVGFRIVLDPSPSPSAEAQASIGH